MKIDYGIVWMSFALALLHFLPIGEAHEALMAISFIPVVICVFLALQLQPREMRPALFAFLRIWVQVGCFILGDHFGWTLRS